MKFPAGNSFQLKLNLIKHDKKKFEGLRQLTCVNYFDRLYFRLMPRIHFISAIIIFFVGKTNIVRRKILCILSVQPLNNTNSNEISERKFFGIEAVFDKDSQREKFKTTTSNINHCHRLFHLNTKYLLFKLNNLTYRLETQSHILYESCI